MPEHSRIKFYSAHDLSSGYHLQEVEKVFQKWDEYTQNPDINTVIELYNIKRYFDDSCTHLSEYKRSALI